MNHKMIVYLTAQIVRAVGILMFLPALVGIIYQEWLDFFVFVGVAVGMILLGTAFTFKKPDNKAVYAREGMCVVACAWIVISFLGALPYVFSGNIPKSCECIL